MIIGLNIWWPSLGNYESAIRYNTDDSKWRYDTVYTIHGWRYYTGNSMHGWRYDTCDMMHGWRYNAWVAIWYWLYDVCMLFFVQFYWVITAPIRNWLLEFTIWFYTFSTIHGWPYNTGDDTGSWFRAILLDNHRSIHDFLHKFAICCFCCISLHSGQVYYILMISLPY